jgi:cytochrome P450
MPSAPAAPLPPGPRSRVPGRLAWQFRTDPLGFLVRAAAEHGDTVGWRVGGRPYVLLGDPEAIRDVLVTQAGKFVKSHALRQAKVTLGDGLLTSDGDFHRRQRKLSQPAFHPQRVATYATAMVRRARQTSGEWQDGATVDLHAEMMKLTLRVVTETLFGGSVDAEIDKIGRAMDVMVTMFRRARNPWAPLLNRLPLPSNIRFVRAVTEVRATVERFVAENRAAGVDRGDLLSTLVRARDTGGEQAEVVGGDAHLASRDRQGAGTSVVAGEGMTDVQLRDELVTLFTAGHETTANALTFTFHLLAQHPAAAARLYAEVDAALPAGRDPTTDDLDRLPFARAVVAESMRLYPPAWTLMREATADVTIGPKAVPLAAGGVVVMSQWIVHRDPRLWPSPETFDPDRWLDPAAKDARPKYAYFPFGGGPRNCIGESFAWTEAILLLVTLAQHWRVEDAASKPMRLLPSITLRPVDPVWVRLRSRSAVAR